MRPSSETARRPRLFAISDLHTDFSVNRKSVQALSNVDYVDDVLVVAGDIADDLEVILGTLTELRARFRRVFYVPGNHELWVKQHDPHSLDKFELILARCQDLGVETTAGQVGSVRILPLFSWYDPNLFESIVADSSLCHWADYRMCRWPRGIGRLSEYFARRTNYEPDPFYTTVSFSHFLPRADLLPSVEYLTFKGLPFVSGSRVIEAQLRRAGSSIHIFGHTHINVDKIISGVRYIQNAFGYPHEGPRPCVLPLKFVTGC